MLHFYMIVFDGFTMEDKYIHWTGLYLWKGKFDYVEFSYFNRMPCIYTRIQGNLFET